MAAMNNKHVCVAQFQSIEEAVLNDIASLKCHWRYITLLVAMEQMPIYAEPE